MIAAYLIEPGRPAYELDDLAAEYGVEALPEPEVEEETAALVRAAEVPRRLAGAAARAPARARQRGALRPIELPLTAVLASMEDAGVKIDTYRMGEITARLADRVEELESQAFELAGEEFMLGSTQQLARILFEKLELTPGRKGKTGYSTDTRVLRTIRARPRDRRGDRGVARADEAAQHLPRAAARAARRGRPPAHALQPGGRRDRTPVDVEPEPAGDPDPHRARPRDPHARSSPSPGTGSCRPTTRRSSCASSRTSPASRSCARRSRAARTSMRRRRPRCSARIRRR